MSALEVIDGNNLYSLLSAANDEDFGIGFICLLGTLAFPTDRACHVSIVGRSLRELLELFSNAVHEVDFPTLSCKNGTDDSRGENKAGLERHNELKISEIVVRSNDLWCRLQKGKVGGRVSGKKVCGSFQDCGLEVERALIPGEREFVTPDACVV